MSRTRNRLRLLAVSTTVGVLVPLAVAQLPAAAESRPDGPANRPDRLARTEGGRPDIDNRFNRRDYRPSATQRRAVAALGEGAQASWSDSGTAHSVFRQDGTLTGPATAPADTIARDFVVSQPALFGLAETEAADLRLTMADRTPAATFLRYQQTAQGRDVFGATLLVVVDAAGRVLMAGGALVPDATAPAPAVSAADAVAAAGADLRPRADLDKGERLANEGKTRRFENTLAVPDYDGTPVTATLVNVDTDAGVRAAWQVDADVASNADYTVLVDAGTGEILLRNNGVSNDAHGTVFPGDDPEAGGRSQQDFPAPWVDAGSDTTSGNNTNTYQDAEGDNAADGDGSDQPHNADQHFDFTWGDAWGNGTGAETDLPLSGADRDAVVTQLFYYTNWFHDYAYGLGFTESARNFQNDNFGNGGSDGDAVEAESDANFTGEQCTNDDGDAIRCLNNANFTTNGSDGNKPRMQMYVGSVGGTRFTQRANNRDTVIHEYAHGISGRIISDTNLSGGLQSGALGEGWSDALATSINNDPVYGEYNNGNYTRGIRSTAYDTSTYTYADLCNIDSDGCQVHSDGEIWSTMMWASREALIDKYGQNDGKDRHERRIVTRDEAHPRLA